MAEKEVKKLLVHDDPYAKLISDIHVISGNPEYEDDEDDIPWATSTQK
jgi:hypothetical protein